MPKAGEEDGPRGPSRREGVGDLARQDAEGPHGVALKLADVIDENGEELARLESLNVGKPWWSPSTSPASCPTTSASSPARRGNLEGKAATEYVEGYTSMIRREPLGIVAGIAPWNYPLFMVMWKLGPALTAGNVQIIKPAEQTPLTVLRFVELAQELLPQGVLQVVTGEGIPTGDRLGDIPRSGSSRSPATRRRGSYREERGGHREARPPRARRQGANGGAGRRRSRDGRGGDQDRRVSTPARDCTASSRILVSDRIYDDVVSSAVTAVEG